MTDTLSPPAANAGNRFSRGGLMLADGTFFEGSGFGAAGSAVGEVCFNTAMTGYQEILSDPSYAGQIVAFTFPHIGIVGTNDEDIETITPAVRGLIVRADAEHPSNYRSLLALDRWLKKHNIPAVAGIDTRALTSLIREKGMPHGVVVNLGDAALDRDALIAKAKGFAGLEGLDLAKGVSSRQSYKWSETPWAWGLGYNNEAKPSFRVTVIDYGVKRNILRLLAGLGAEITVVPADAGVDEVMRSKPHGVLLSNGPGDPAATGEYAIPTIKAVIEAGVPVFGICLGHQMLGLALGAKTRKMGPGPSRRQPSGEGHPDRQGRDRVDESRLHGGQRDPSRRGQGNPCVAVRRHQLRHRPGRQGCVRGAVSSRSLARTDGFALSVRAVRGGGEEAGLRRSCFGETHPSTSSG